MVLLQVICTRAMVLLQVLFTQTIYYIVAGNMHSGYGAATLDMSGATDSSANSSYTQNGQDLNSIIEWIKTNETVYKMMQKAKVNFQYIHYIIYTTLYTLYYIHYIICTTLYALHYMHYIICTTLHAPCSVLFLFGTLMWKCTQIIVSNFIICCWKYASLFYSSANDCHTF